LSPEPESPPSPAERALSDVLAALGESLKNLVLVGGWLPFIYARHLWRMGAVDIPQTTDIDLGVGEIGAGRFQATVFEKLTRAGLAAESIHPGEATPLQFVHRKGRTAVRVEFLTSEFVSDDTRARFLGKNLAWSRLAAFEVLLKETIPLWLDLGGKSFQVKTPPPARYFYHKALIFEARDNEYKMGKDLYTFWWGLRFAPEPDALIQEILALKGDEFFPRFTETMAEQFKDAGSPGYALLMPFLKSWVAPGEINRLIGRTMAPFLEALKA
jgi:hypothetical protein